MRPLIQYDLDEPPTTTPAARRPPAKKRRRQHQHQHQSHHQHQPHPHLHPHAQRPRPPKAPPVQHWDDPESAVVGMVYDEEDVGSVMIPGVRADEEEGEGEYGETGAGAEEEEEEEESRPLTHDEIWDDAALVDAWNSAEAEYEAYHGTSKPWKTEPVKRSPLWYNKPCVGTTPQHHDPGPSQPQSHDDVQPETDTAPLDFNTYVPTHDPSLAATTGPSNGASASTTPAPFFVPPPSTTMVSRDEAFNNALSAMYWSGYWTAVYHNQSQSQSQTTENNDDGPTEATEEDDIDDEDLVPTQR